MESGNDDEVKTLIEEQVVAIKLDKHQKVSELSTKVQKKLVELLDDKLLGSEHPDYDVRENNLLLSVEVSSICQKLAHQGKLAATYSEVIEFVHLRDMICLGTLVGAVPEKHGQVPVDFDELTRVFRKSVYLLRSANLHKLNQSELYLDRRCISRSTGIGFPTFHITDFNEACQSLDYIFSESRNLFKSRATRGESTLDSILPARWFEQFVSESLNQCYPMDRFTLLVAIWIVANECKHKSLQQLIGNLVDQIFHEEANSCNEEELMLLTQVGSFWLSHHKRYQATFIESAYIESQFEDVNEQSRASSSNNDDSSISPSNSSADLLIDKHNDEPMRLDSITGNLRAKLRKVIDLELLHGTQCLLCGHQPSQLLDLLSVASCSGCGNELFIEHCSLSFKPIPLFSLSALKNFRPNLTSVALINPSDWLRHILRANKVFLSRKTFAKDANTPTERIDITETFEKLTVIRDNKSNESDSDNDRGSHNGESDSDHEQERCYYNMLNEFAKSTDSKRSIKSTEIHLSESVRMLHFSDKNTDVLAVRTSDLLLLDYEPVIEHFLRVRFIASTNFIEAGSLWQCIARSAVSKLPFGCGRLFGSLELIRSGKAERDTFSDSFACPYCKCQLSKVNSFYDNQDSLTN